MPIDGRQALAVTLEQWQAVRDRRWLGRGSFELVALDGDRAVASLLATTRDGVALLDLLADADGAAGLALLLDRAAGALAGAERVIALAPAAAGPLERLLRERGLEPGAQYIQLCRRTALPQAALARARGEVAVPGDA